MRGGPSHRRAVGRRRHVQAALDRRGARALPAGGLPPLARRRCRLPRPALRAPGRPPRPQAAGGAGGATVSVVRIDPADPRWDDYVRAQPHARPYHLGPWAAVLRGAYGFRPEYLALVDGEAVRGVLPLMGNRGLAGRRLRSLPALPAAGPLADSPEGERELLAAARERAAASGATLTVRTRSPALEIDGLRRRPMYASFVLALPDDPDELRARWRRQSSNLHRSIERARREGVSV